MKTEQEILKEISDKYVGEYAVTLEKITNEFQQQKLMLIGEYRNTIQNMLVVSGVIATFALASIGTVIPKVDNLIILGVVTLILNTAVIFRYLLSKQGSSAKKLKKLEREYILPFGKIRTNFIKLKRGEVSVNDYLIGEENVKKELRDKIPDTLEEETTDNWDFYFQALFYLALSSIALAFILPYLLSV